MAKHRRRVETATSFLNPSGKNHTGKTYEDYYSKVDETRPKGLDWMVEGLAHEQAVNDILSSRPLGKGRPAGAIRPRHQHDWLVRHDYMQCRICGKFVTPKKERGSVDR